MPTWNYQAEDTHRSPFMWITEKRVGRRKRPGNLIPDFSFYGSIQPEIKGKLITSGEVDLSLKMEEKLTDIGSTGGFKDIEIVCWTVKRDIGWFVLVHINQLPVQK